MQCHICMPSHMTAEQWIFRHVPPSIETRRLQTYTEELSPLPNAQLHVCRLYSPMHLSMYTDRYTFTKTRSAWLSRPQSQMQPTHTSHAMLFEHKMRSKTWRNHMENVHILLCTYYIDSKISYIYIKWLLHVHILLCQYNYIIIYICSLIYGLEW